MGSLCYFQCVKRAQIPTSMKEAMWNIEEENNEEEKRRRDGGWAQKSQSHLFTLIHWYQLSHGALWFSTLTLHSLIVNPLGPESEPTTSV